MDRGPLKSLCLKRNAMKIGSKILGLVGLLSLLSLAAYGQMGMGDAGTSKSEAVADAKGNLHVPGDYRTTYQFLGTWAVAEDQGQGSKQIHVVYASPGTIAAYRKSGRFPEGAV